MNGQTCFIYFHKSVQLLIKFLFLHKWKGMGKKSQRFFNIFQNGSYFQIETSKRRPSKPPQNHCLILVPTSPMKGCN